MDPDELAAVPQLMLPGSAWAIRREALDRVTDAYRTAPEAWAQAAQRAAAAAVPKVARRSMTERAGGAVAVLPLCGILSPRGSLLSYIFGGGYGGLQDFRDNFRDAINNPDIGAVVIDIDSPGGLISLVPETADEIAAARGTKPIIAVANTMAASGAYWIGAQADKFVATTSGQVGSVGVYLVHEDYSAWNEKAGISPTYISAGKYKTEGNSDEPLSDETKAAWQEEVDDLYAMFVDAVATGRGISSQEVIANYGEGRTLIAERALAAGMIDEIATIEDVIDELLGGSNGNAGASARRLIITPTPAPRANAVPPAPRAADLDQDEDDDTDGDGDEPDDEQRPRCDCGKFVEDGETQCDECKASADETPDAEGDDPEAEAAAADARSRGMTAIHF